MECYCRKFQNFLLKLLQFFQVLGDNCAAFWTVHIEAVGMIRPAGNLGAFLQKCMTTLGTAVIVPAKTPPGQKPLKRVFHFDCFSPLNSRNPYLF